MVEGALPEENARIGGALEGTAAALGCGSFTGLESRGWGDFDAVFPFWSFAYFLAVGSDTVDATELGTRAT